jgi:hypothetical protein
MLKKQGANGKDKDARDAIMIIKHLPGASQPLK